MSRSLLRGVMLFSLISLILVLPMQGQQALPALPGNNAAPTTAATEAGNTQTSSSTRLIPFSDTLPGQPDGALTITFAIYPDQESTTQLWSETQVVQLTGGKYTALLGSSSPQGVSFDLFAGDAAHWLGVQVNGSERRFLLVSVPYAMKAVEADRLGGLLPSDFVTAAQLAAILKNSAGAGPAVAGQPPATGSGTFRAQAAPAGTTPQPATDFTDNNASEVLLVTQQGTGYAIHAITSGQQEAIFAQNDAIGGTALRAFATYPSGQSIGLLAETASPDGIAALFNNRAGGKILSLRSNGAEVSSFDSLGNLTANGVNATNVNAQSYFGNGFGLTNIPPSAVGAQFANFPGAIVQRDGNGDFSAGQISAQNFIGSGFGLTNIPPSAVGAQFANFPGAIVQRDGNGNFSAGQISALNFIGSGFGLTNIPPGAVGAQFVNFPGAIVQRDGNGDFSAGQISALNFVGSGFGLTNIPPSAVGAQFVNFPGAIVQRDGNGNFAANQISASALNLSGNADFTAAASTAPVKAVLSSNTPTSCQASKELLIKTDASAGQQLFICNAAGNGYVLVGDGTAAGVAGVAAGDGSVAIGGTSAQPTIAVASGGITADKLAPNAVTAVNIADGSLSPAKITGTAATLGINNFKGSQSVEGNMTVFATLTTIGFNANNASIGGTPGTALTVTGGNTGISVSGTDKAITASSNSGTAVSASSTNSFAMFGSSINSAGVHGEGATGVEATTANGTGLRVTATGTTGTAVPAIISNAVAGKLISGRLGSTTNFTENFAVDTSGNLLSAGALTTQYPAGGSLTFNTFVRLAQGPLGAQVFSMNVGDVTGAIGIATGANGTQVQVAYAGTASCNFDFSTPVTPGDYVGLSPVAPGWCRDLGTVYPSDGGQVVGKVAGPVTAQAVPVMLFGPEHRSATGGTLTTINTGAGLTGGPITSSGTISIAVGGITNTMLQNNSVSLTPGTGLSGGGIVPLGGSVTLNNAGTLSFNGRTGNVVASPGDYSFSQLAGTVSAAQLPPDIAYKDQPNTFSNDQAIQGNLSTTGNMTASGTLTASALSLTDSGPANGLGPLSVISQNNPAATLISLAPQVLVVGNATRGLMILDSTGNLNLGGGVTATSYSGDGSGLSNVNAGKIGTLSPSDIATNTALAAETSARQSADATLQTSIGAETAARQVADASLSAGISTETTARQSDVANLQTSINNVSAADAKLAASNIFSAGTQDFSGAGATLPVRTVLSSNTPATCVASKELLIKTDAPAGQQLFICDASGTSWNLVGDGASGGVTAFNGRSGSVSPATGDYSFSQISGSAAQAQLPASTVYNNQANTFSASQTVNGTVTANLFTGSGSGLVNVNAATLNGVSSNAFAQLNAVNTFTSEQVLSPSNAVNPSLNMPSGTAPATPLAGDIWNNGGVIQYRDNASTTRSLVSTTQNGGMQMLKIVGSITPTPVANQTCAEQSFAVAGLSTGDVLLAVLQPGNSSPGANIAIGGWRVTANNTVAIQFCNVSRNNSTPVSGAYTFAVMR